MRDSPQKPKSGPANQYCYSLQFVVDQFVECRSSVSVEEACRKKANYSDSAVMDREIRASLDSALEEVERKKRELDRLIVDALRYGYDEIVNVPYNGDCFFSAIALHLAQDSNLPETLTAHELRRQLVSFMSTKVCCQFNTLIQLQQLYQPAQ